MRALYNETIELHCTCRRGSKRWRHVKCKPDNDRAYAARYPVIYRSVDLPLCKDFGCMTFNLQDEIIQLPAPSVISDQRPTTTDTPRGKEIDQVSHAVTPLPKGVIEHHPLVPPHAIFQPINYSPLHIFVSMVKSCLCDILYLCCTCTSISFVSNSVKSFDCAHVSTP